VREGLVRHSNIPARCSEEFVVPVPYPVGDASLWPPKAPHSRLTTRACYVTRASATPWLLFALTLMQSGIDISEELLGLFEEVKLRHKHKFIIFSLKQTGKVRRWPQFQRAGWSAC
jgi:hypothetical protein